LVPASVTTIGDSSFSGSRKLESVLIPQEVTDIGNHAFSDCILLKSLTLPDGLFTVGDHAFYGCGTFHSITIPRSVSHIGTYAFAACRGLKSVSILSSAPGFGWLVFRDCVKLERLAFAGHAPTVDRGLSKELLPHLKVYHFEDKIGFTSPKWFGYPTVNMGAATPVKSWLIKANLVYDLDLQTDPNGDGVNLLMAYALNLNPNQNLTGSLPQPVISDHGMHLNFYAGTPAVSYSVESSADLITWSTERVTLSGLDANQSVTATVDRSSPSRFMRLVVTH
jgi:hypothetical protein